MLRGPREQDQPRLLAASLNRNEDKLFILKVNAVREGDDFIAWVTCHLRALRSLERADCRRDQRTPRARSPTSMIDSRCGEVL